MKKGRMIAFIVAASLILLGIIIFAGAMTVIGWNFRSFDTNKFETNTHEITDAFGSICVDTDTADIALFKSEDGRCKVVCYEDTRLRHSVSVTDGALTIKLEDTRKWYEHISLFSFGNSMISIYLPEAEYSALTVREDTGDIGIPKALRFESIIIKCSTGDVRCYASTSGKINISTTTGSIMLESISAGSAELSVSTGNIKISSMVCEGELDIAVSTGKSELRDISAQSLISSGTTGKISLYNVITAEKLSVKRSTGDVRLDGCDAAEISIVTDTGDVSGSLLSEKVFIVRTDTGDVDVPKTATGGICEITTDTGDIEISIR